MRRIALPCLLLVTIGCGAKKEPSLIGNWNIPVETVPDLVANLKEGGTAELNGTYQAIKVKATGTWELKEKALTVKLNQVEVPKELEALRSMFKKEEDKLKVPVTMQIEWVNDDEVKVTPPTGVSELFNKPFVMRRQVASK